MQYKITLTFFIDENDYSDVKGVEQVGELVQAILNCDADKPNNISTVIEPKR